MSFLEHTPSNALADYIAAYWVRKTERPGRVYADGCVDLIANTGEAIVYFNSTARLDKGIPLHPGHIYLGGTMTAYGVVTGGELTGIRFRPGGFFALYGASMRDAVDGLVEFPDEALYVLLENGQALDAHFLAKAPDKNRFTSMYKSVYDTKGQLSVEELSANFHVAVRTMERIFKENVGISPKEFIKIVRFQEVLRRLRQASAQEESLLRLAFDLGYYDHAHLTNEFKRYAGIRPSELSRFYKTGIAGEQYF